MPRNVIVYIRAARIVCHLDYSRCPHAINITNIWIDAHRYRGRIRAWISSAYPLLSDIIPAAIPRVSRKYTNNYIPRRLGGKSIVAIKYPQLHWILPVEIASSNGTRNQSLSEERNLSYAPLLRVMNWKGFFTRRAAERNLSISERPILHTHLRPPSAISFLSCASFSFLRFLLLYIIIATTHTQSITFFGKPAHETACKGSVICRLSVTEQMGCSSCKLFRNKPERLERVLQSVLLRDETRMGKREGCPQLGLWSAHSLAP